MATGDNFILNVWKSEEELNYIITAKSRKMTSLDSLFVGVTLLLCLTSSQNITLNLSQSGDQESSQSVTERALDTTQTLVERLDDCEEDEWSCHQKGKVIF